MGTCGAEAAHGTKSRDLKWTGNVRLEATHVQFHSRIDSTTSAVGLLGLHVPLLHSAELQCWFERYIKINTQLDILAPGHAVRMTDRKKVLLPNLSGFISAREKICHDTPRHPPVFSPALWNGCPWVTWKETPQETPQCPVATWKARELMQHM